jgi:hypothetical protein
LHASLTTLLFERITVAKSKDAKIGCNLAESSKEGCDSKRAVLPLVNDDYGNDL